MIEINFKAVSDYGLTGEKESDPVAALAAATLCPLEDVKEIDEDGNVERRLHKNGEEVGLEDLYAVLVGMVGPYLREILVDEIDGPEYLEKFERDSLVSALNRCYDIRELENIYRAVWFDVNYWNRAGKGEVPATLPWRDR